MLFVLPVLLIQTQVAPDLDLVIQHQAADLVLQFQSRTNPALRYALARTSGPSDCLWQVERATSTDAVLTCLPEKGARQLMRKFVYDVRAKALVKQIDFPPSPMRKVLVRENRVILIGPTLSMEYSDSGFRVLKESRPLRNEAKLPPDRCRPDMKEQIGAWQSVGAQTWFGKRFYDGEGETGVGGFGYCENGHVVQMYVPSEIARWSTSAILVEPDAVWLGLVHDGEYGSVPGGVLRFDRSTKRSQRFDLPEVVYDFSRSRSAVIMATDLGVAIYEEGRIRRFLASRTTDGRWIVSEATQR